MSSIDPSEPSPPRGTIEPIAMRVPDACRFIGLSRSTLYVLIASGEIEIVKMGSSTLVITESLKNLIVRRRRPALETTRTSGHRIAGHGQG